MSKSGEMELVLTLTANAEMDDERLEARMFEVLDAVERNAPAAVLGPVVAVDFEAQAIELAFSAELASLSAAQALASEVIAVIEQHTDIGFAEADTSARDSGVEQPVLVA